MDTVKFLLPEERIPRAWYNIAADLPKPLAPVLHPGTRQPIGPDDLAPLFPMALIMQEVSQEREIEIPGPVRSVYAQWRPSPLFRARRLEAALDTPAKIYYKYEGVSPAGSHKPNTAVPQAYYNKRAGIKRLATETGAGQWGSALSLSCQLFGLECTVYMVRVSYDQKPYRRAMMEAFGATVTASPSGETQSGRAILAEHPDSTGSGQGRQTRPGRSGLPDPERSPGQAWSQWISSFLLHGGTDRNGVTASMCGGSPLGAGPLVTGGAVRSSRP